MSSETREEAFAAPGSPEEVAAFSTIQSRFPDIYRQVFSDPKAPRTVVVLPSMSLDVKELEKIPGVIHYEERMLCLLMLLRLPRTEIVYVSSIQIDPAIIDYYLHLLPGVPRLHAERRLRFISMDDPSLEPLSKKIVDRPSVLEELRQSIAYPEAAHMTVFNSSPLERTIAVRLGIPLYACDPALTHLGNKSMSRQLLRAAGLEVPYGFEELRDRGDIAGALVEMSKGGAGDGRVVLKLNEGFSGEGNAIVDLRGLADASSPRGEALKRLTNGLAFAATGENWSDYEGKFETMGGIAETLIEDTEKRSPSVQMRIDPLGELQLVSTHDQVLSGPDGQVFDGCTFPASIQYRSELHDAGRRVAQVLRDKGVLGRFGVDFVSVPTDRGWRHHAIEINLRKGGTTLPYLMLEFLTGGTYDAGTGEFSTPTGATRSYYATDNLVEASYRGLTPEQLIDRMVYEGLHYHAATHEGLVFHLLGAVTEHGKLGAVSIARSVVGATAQYQRAVAKLDHDVP